MARLLVVILAAAFSTGCLTFNAGLVPETDLPPKIEEEDERPVVEVRLAEWIHTLNGERTEVSMMDTESGGRVLAKNMVRRWHLKGLVGDFGYPRDLDGASPDYRVTVSGELRERGSMAAAVLTGLTFLLFPSSSSVTRVFRVSLEDLETENVYEVEAENGHSTWMWLPFLPLLPLSPVGNVNAAFDLYDHIYDQLAGQGAFQRTRGPADSEDSAADSED